MIANAIIGQPLQLDTVQLCQNNVCDTFIFGIDTPTSILERFGTIRSSDEIKKYAGKHAHGSFYKHTDIKYDSLGIIFEFKSNRYKAKNQADTANTYLYKIYVIPPSTTCLSYDICIGKTEVEIDSIMSTKGIPILTEPTKKIVLYSLLGIELRFTLVEDLFILTQIATLEYK